MKKNRLLGGILLISGTTIGAGMLALPISTGIVGFFPALLIFFLCFLVMYWAGCLFLEVTLSFEGEVNLISMAQKTLGSAGQGFVWLGFLLLLYSLLAAYLAGSGPYFASLYQDMFGEPMASWAKPFPIVILFGPFLYVGIRSVDMVNRYLMIGLVLSYALMVALLTPEVDVSRLAHVDMSFAFFSIAVVITSFGYQIIIPSLSNYLDRDVSAVKKAMFFGSIIPLVVYVIWEFLVLGNIPVHGETSLAALADPTIELALDKVLASHVESTVIGYGMRTFALLAIITSFLGIAQSLFDFLRDGFKVPNTTSGRLTVWVITFVPPFLFVLLSEKGFETILEYAGAIVAMITGIVPILMVWSLRYVKKTPSIYRASGGKPALVAGLLVFVGLIVLVLLKNMQIMNLDLSVYTG